MGQASRSPGNGKVFYHITDHAVQRLRERATIHPSLTDRDVKCLIDEALKHARNLGMVEPHLREGYPPTELINLTKTLDPTLAAGEVAAVVEEWRLVKTILPIDEARSFVDRRDQPQQAPRGPFNPVLREKP